MSSIPPPPNDSASLDEGADNVAPRSGALEKHPRFAEAAAEYESWVASLPQTERGGPGQRKWRARCVAKACELLYAKTGRATGGAVLKIIGFGSSTDVSVDVREWVERAAPRRDAWLQLSPLLESQALRECVEGAVMQILSNAQQEARKLAQAELDSQRAVLEEERTQARLEVTRALAARDAAMDSAAAFERERDEHARARQQAEAHSARLQGQLDESAATLAAAARRERDLHAELERKSAETNAAIGRLEDVANGYKARVDRLEGDQRRLLMDVDEARDQSRRLRADVDTRAAEVASLTARNTDLAHEAARSGASAAAAEARAKQLEAEVLARQAAQSGLQQDLAAANEELARERASRHGREQRVLAVRREATRHAVIAAVLRARNAEVAVDGDVLPRMELQAGGEAITPRFDSVSQLEAYCGDHQAELVGSDAKPRRTKPK